MHTNLHPISHTITVVLCILFHILVFLHSRKCTLCSSTISVYYSRSVAQVIVGNIILKLMHRCILIKKECSNGISTH